MQNAIAIEFYQGFCLLANHFVRKNLTSMLALL